MTADPTLRAALVPGGIAAHASCLLVKLGQVAYRLQEDRLAPLDLRVRHFSVLQGLADAGPIVQLELARYLRIDPATMAAALDHLEQRGAVARTRSPQDKRRYVVTLTQAGIDLLADAQAALSTVDEAIGHDLSAAEASQLHALLGRLGASAALADAYDAGGGSA